MSSHNGEEGGIRHTLTTLFKKYVFEFDPFLGLDPDPALKSSFINWVGSLGVSRGLVLTCFFIGYLSILTIQIPNLLLFATGWLVGTAPIWLPCALYWAAWKAWVNYVRSGYIYKIKPCVLEVHIPHEILKSPRAMEMIFANLWASSGEVTAISRGWNGGTRPWFSFEVASFGGEIHFYVWCWSNYRRQVETAIYAQYPEVEIVEVEDYMSKFHFDPKKHVARVGDYIYKGGLGGDEYPLKTYEDFGLEEEIEEEFLVDPLATFFETLSNLKPTEQVWIQVMYRLDGKDGVIVQKANDWKHRIEKAVDQIRKEMIYREDANDKGFPRPTWHQNELMRTMERQMHQVALQAGLRFIYLSESGLDGPTFTAIRWIYKLYNWPNFAQQMRSGRGHDPFDFPWQDYKNIRWVLTIRRHIDAMRRRSFFTTPWITPFITMTPELLASLYHYPSGAIKAPGLHRIHAKKSEPPSNLPQ